MLINPPLKPTFFRLATRQAIYAPPSVDTADHGARDTVVDSLVIHRAKLNQRSPPPSAAAQSDTTVRVTDQTEHHSARILSEMLRPVVKTLKRRRHGRQVTVAHFACARDDFLSDEARQLGFRGGFRVFDLELVEFLAQGEFGEEGVVEVGIVEDEISVYGCGFFGRAWCAGGFPWD